jgi:quercetin dioxygenase-like cupin family protein
MSSYAVIRSILDEISVPDKGILSHTIHNDDSVKIILFGFAPGQELTAHTAPMPATVQIVQGEVQVASFICSLTLHMESWQRPRC